MLPGSGERSEPHFFIRKAVERSETGSLPPPTRRAGRYGDPGRTSRLFRFQAFRCVLISLLFPCAGRHPAFRSFEPVASGRLHRMGINCG